MQPVELENVEADDDSVHKDNIYDDGENDNRGNGDGDEHEVDFDNDEIDATEIVVI